jgi:hypothetical protein
MCKFIEHRTNRQISLVVATLLLAAGSSSLALAQGAGVVRDPMTGQLYERPDPSCRLLLTEPRRWQCPPRAAFRATEEPTVTGSIGGGSESFMSEGFSRGWNLPDGLNGDMTGNLEGPGNVKGCGYLGYCGTK